MEYRLEVWDSRYAYMKSNRLSIRPQYLLVLNFLRKLWEKHHKFEKEIENDDFEVRNLFRVTDFEMDWLKIKPVVDWFEFWFLAWSIHRNEHKKNKKLGCYWFEMLSLNLWCLFRWGRKSSLSGYMTTCSIYTETNSLVIHAMFFLLP